MNILILFCVIFGVALAQRGEIRDCDQGQDGSSSGRDLHDIYQRPPGYDSVDYIPHTSYGPPDPERSSPSRKYPQDPPSYNEIRPAPVYGPPPPRTRVAAAAGIYDDYDDILYTKPAPPPPPPIVRRYNYNYAHREPYYPRYDAYAIRRHPEYRVPVYYAPLIPDGFIPVHSHSPTPAAAIEKPTTTEETRSQSSSTPESYQSEHRHTSSTEEENNYDEGQIIRRQQPTVVAVNTSPVQNEIKRHLFRKPFIGLRKLFRGSILAKRDKIGLIPSFIKGSTNNF